MCDFGQCCAKTKAIIMKKQRHLLSLPASEKIGGKLPCLDWRFA
mgnify:CR=1 FL=1